ncbi:nucleoside deaminase [Candidatus Woesearchaeota archaeon]|nr:nucleoside deaminase [Candidatus Woesearchaeota archaeon]
MYLPVPYFMKAAILEAQEASSKGDYAIGAVIVRDREILIATGNRIKLDNDPTQHAEIVAIRRASQLLGNRHLEDCILYATHEPCPMCAGAAIWARMKGIVYGATIEDMIQYSQRNGNHSWSWRTIDIPASLILEKGEPRLLLVKEFMRDECKRLFRS